MSSINIPTPRAFKPLLEPSRYKGIWGGRGSGKSHFFAELLVERHLLIKGCRSVCIREVQKTLKDSAKRLIEDKIKKYNLEQVGFKILHDRIETPNDGVIVFVGMTDHTAESVKSLEGFNTAWVEEAQTLSHRSLQLLRPTIRAAGSEIWFSWNPTRKIDAVDELLRGDSVPTNSIVVKANWDSNPWFPDELNQERLDDMRQRPDSYEHVWEGGYIVTQDGAYYAKVLTQARQGKRITNVQLDPLMSVYAFWDIGGTGAKADACSIWIVQFIKQQIKVIDYYEAVGQELSDHVGWLRSNGYGKAEIRLPHDGVKHDLVHRVTYESELKKAGFKVQVLPNAGAGAAMMRIEATRRIFHNVWIDKERCAGGLEALGWYHEKRDPTRNIGLGPEHDWSSHACDAFGYMAVESEKMLKQRANGGRPIRIKNDFSVF